MTDFSGDTNYKKNLGVVSYNLQDQYAVHSSGDRLVASSVRHQTTFANHKSQECRQMLISATLFLLEVASKKSELIENCKIDDAL